MEKCRQKKASTQINPSTCLKLEEVGSIISGGSDSLYDGIEDNPTENPEFVFPSTSSGS